MKYIFFFIALLFISITANAGEGDTITTVEHSSVLVVPYMPAMHLSDADPDISQGSEMDMAQMRAAFRSGIVKALNKDFSEVYDTRELEKNSDFTKEDIGDMENIYHAVMFETDSVYPLKDPKRFAIKDTSTQKKKDKTKVKPEKTYINVAIHDQLLIPELSKKFNADYFIFLNELDIKTHFEDCINLAMKIYRRDIKIHYTIFDKNGKQLYGDVAVSNFDSNSNDVNDIMAKNFPAIADYILASLKKVSK